MTLPSPRDGFTAVGLVLRAHGIKGELRVRAFAPGAPNLQPGRDVYLRGERCRIRRAREDRSDWIVQIEGLADRTAAESARGQLLECPDGDVRRAEPDSYFVHELIGLRGVTPDGRDLGVVTEVLQTGANDVYVFRGDGGEVLIPAIGEAIQSINVSEGLMVITPLPGLLDESQ